MRRLFLAFLLVSGTICVYAKDVIPSQLLFQKLTHDIGDLSVHSVFADEGRYLIATNRGVIETRRENGEVNFPLGIQKKEIHTAYSLKSDVAIAADDHMIYLSSAKNESMTRKFQTPTKNEYIICQDSHSSYYNYGLSYLHEHSGSSSSLYRSCAGLVTINFEQLQASILRGEQFNTHHSEISAYLPIGSQSLLISGRDMILLKNNTHIKTFSKLISTNKHTKKEIQEHQKSIEHHTSRKSSLGIIDTALPIQMKASISTHDAISSIAPGILSPFIEKEINAIGTYHGAKYIVVVPKRFFQEYPYSLYRRHSTICKWSDGISQRRGYHQSDLYLTQ